MTAVLLPNGEQTFFDNNGDPLALGKVYFYVPNTTTPKLTWQDSAKGTQNTNPVTLDDAGRAIIYGEGIYRQVVTNADGDTIWDQLTTGLDGQATLGIALLRSDIPSTTLSVSTFPTIGFATAGDNGTGAIYTSEGAGPSGPMAIQDAVGTWFQLVITEPVNAGWFGVLPGVDGTARINVFFNYLAANHLAGTFGPGVFIYNGTGGSGNAWAGSLISLSGSGADTCSITIGSGYYLIDTSVAKTDIDVSGFTFSGGLGVFRSTFSGVNVSNHKTFYGNVFEGYTECAIQANGSDEPYWKINNNSFSGANSTGTIGIALPLNANNSNVENNSFLLNRVHIKLRGAGPTVSVQDNDFIQFDAGNPASPRMAIWFVPGGEDGGIGNTVRNNKYGNENLQTVDYANVIADEGTGTYNGDIMPVLNVTSTANFIGHTFTENAIAGAGDPSRAFIFSTTPNFIDNQIFGNVIYGTYITAIVQFLDPPPFDRLSTQNTLGPNQATQGSEFFVFPLVLGGDGFGFSPDPEGVFEIRPQNPHGYMGGGQDYAGYIELYNSSASPLAANGATTNLGAVADASGGIDAAQYHLPIGTAGNITGTILAATVTTGIPSWIEFDLKQGAADPLTIIRTSLIYSSTTDIHWKRYISVSSTWNRYRFPFIFREQTGAIALVFDTLLGFNSTTPTGQIYIGRARVYHAREPIAFGRSTFEQMNLSLIPTGAGIAPVGLNAGSVWIDTSAGNVLKMI